MTINKVLIKMIEYSNKNLHDINHLLKVHSFAQIIGKAENISEKDMTNLQIASILHDIACPLCREKYGNTNGKYQEQEGIILTREFLEKFDLSIEDKERIIFLVGNHHTIDNITGIDYQILIEADYLVNAHESDYSKSNITNMMEKVFKTETGIKLLKSIYLD